MLGLRLRLRPRSEPASESPLFIRCTITGGGVYLSNLRATDGGARSVRVR